MTICVLLLGSSAFAGSMYADPPGAGNRDSNVNAGTYTGSVQVRATSTGTWFYITLSEPAHGYPEGTVIAIEDDDLTEDQERLLRSQADKQNADGTPDADNTVTIGANESVNEVTTGPVNQGDG